MLVLSRKAQESLIIDGNITVRVTRILGNRVTLAIEAPKDIRIVRGEILNEATLLEQGTPLPPKRTTPFPRSLQ